MDNKQLIIAVGREFGSAGHIIAEKLAEHFGLSYYDKNILKEVLDDKGIQNSEIHQYDEKHKRLGIYRTVRGMDSSPEALIANLQFDFLKKKAEQGESFVVVGRCAESVLKGYPALVSIFVLGDKQDKVKRIAEHHNLSLEEADAFRMKMDDKRKKYHNQYCEGKWGDSRNYEISINSSKIGIEKATEILIDYIEARQRDK